MKAMAETQVDGHRGGDKATTPHILCVDDEANILSALRRLLRPEGYRVSLAQSGAEGLALLERDPADVVVSDMRMPGMDGARFLAEVARRWPRTVRILLTGYADLESTVTAINEGGIWRYIGKPWEENDLKLAVRRALEQRALEAERDRLLELTRRQNEELRALNANLEREVEARTEEIRQTAMFLETAYEEAKRAYAEAIPVIAGLVELREGIAQGHASRVATLARTIGERLGLDEEALRVL